MTMPGTAEDTNFIDALSTSCRQNLGKLLVGWSGWRALKDSVLQFLRHLNLGKLFDIDLDRKIIADKMFSYNNYCS